MAFLIVFNLVPDPCRSDPCDVNAICEREGLLSNGFICICQPPFSEGTGFNCSGLKYNKISLVLRPYSQLFNVARGAWG